MTINDPNAVKGNSQTAQQIRQAAINAANASQSSNQGTDKNSIFKPN